MGEGHQGGGHHGAINAAFLCLTDDVWRFFVATRRREQPPRTTVKRQSAEACGFVCTVDRLTRLVQKYRREEKVARGVTYRCTLIPRNPALPLAIGLALWMAMPAARAQEYPVKPVRMLVGFPAGGATNFVAALMAPKYSEALKQPVSVERRPGRNGTAATSMVAKAAPDGYTINLASIGSLVIVPALAKVSYNPVRDLAPVSQVVSMPNVFMVYPGAPSAQLNDLIALAKKNPRGLTYATVGNGMPGQLAGELFKSTAKIDIREVKYTTRSAAIDDLVTGHINLLVAATPTAVPQIKAGKARALAVTASRRIFALPEVPTAEETGLGGYEATTWYGIVVPAGTPQRVIDRLHKETATILSMPEIERKLNARGIEVSPTLPEQFFAYIKSETAKWTKVIHTNKSANSPAEKSALNP
jgi:tripartite-type tricarboxylate transporter receptor subunit TctC